MKASIAILNGTGSVFGERQEMVVDLGILTGEKDVLSISLRKGKDEMIYESLSREMTWILGD